MAKKKTSKPEKIEIEVVSHEGASPFSEVSVYSSDKVFVRSYSQAEHGDNYKELAWQYAKKIGGVVQ